MMITAVTGDGSDRDRLASERRRGRLIIILLTLLIVLLGMYVGWQSVINKVESEIALELSKKAEMTPPPEVALSAWPTFIFTKEIGRIEISAENAVARGLAIEDLQITMHHVKVSLPTKAGQAEITKLSSGEFSANISEQSIQHVLPSGSMIDLKDGYVEVRFAVLPGYPVSIVPQITDDTISFVPATSTEPVVSTEKTPTNGELTDSSLQPGPHNAEAARRMLGDGTDNPNGFLISGNVTAFVRSVEIGEDVLQVSGVIRSN